MWTKKVCFLTSLALGFWRVFRSSWRLATIIEYLRRPPELSFESWDASDGKKMKLSMCSVDPRGVWSGLSRFCAGLSHRIIFFHFPLLWLSDKNHYMKSALKGRGLRASETVFFFCQKKKPPCGWRRGRVLGPWAWGGRGGLREYGRRK